jgi:hypothetical protein
MLSCSKNGELLSPVQAVAYEPLVNETFPNFMGGLQDEAKTQDEERLERVAGGSMGRLRCHAFSTSVYSRCHQGYRYRGGTRR